MGLRERFLAGLARQLGHPRGLPGRLIGARLNRGNRTTVAEAVDALSLTPGTVAADIGFGGGVGLELLLAKVGDTGHVHGVDVSTTMLAGAARRFRRDIGAGRLHLHRASMVKLPLADESVDGVVTVNTIYFVADLAGAFAEFARALKPAGQLVVGLTDPAAMAEMPFAAHGFRSRSVSEVTDVLRDAGLSVEDDRRHGAGPYPYHLLVCRLTTRPS